MPRPKRTKVAPSLPLSHVPRHSASTFRRNPSRITSGRPETVSNDSESLVTAFPEARNAIKETSPAQTAAMSGGLSVEDKKSVNSRPRRGVGKTTSRVTKGDDHVKVLE